MGAEGFQDGQVTEVDMIKVWGSKDTIDHLLNCPVIWACKEMDHDNRMFHGSATSSLSSHECALQIPRCM